MSTTPYMNLELPTVSETLGPEWAQEVNDAFETVDSHDHTDGNGARITPAGMDINTNLDMQVHGLLRALYAQISGVASADTSKLGSVQSIGGDVYWVNSAGFAVQITSGNSVVSSGSGVLSPSVVASYPYTILTSDAQKVLIIDTASARTLTLPSASNAMYVAIKDGEGLAQANRITIKPDGSDTIDSGSTDYYIDANNASAGFLSDGVSNWYVI